MIRMIGTALLAAGVGALPLVTAGAASAGPFCYETGPGYQKCVDNGDYFNPIYQGPTLDSEYFPRATSPSWGWGY